MTEWLLIFAAAIWAGLINSVVGSGTLVTFPTLVWLGFSPLTANISNNLGLIPGAVTAYLGSKKQIAKIGLLRSLAIWSLVGGGAGAILLTVLPARVFADVVPVIILFGVVLVVVSPWLSERRGNFVSFTILALSVLLAGIYGGYFGAAQGVILLGVLSAFGGVDLHQANALKNALVVIVNGVAGVVFLFSGRINWNVVCVVAIGSILGARVGSRYGQLMPTNVYRGLIVVVGLIAATWFWLT